jgi:DNA-binding LytR/AlgR family response regulator
MNCIIVDDELMSRYILEQAIKKVPFLNLVKVCSSADEAVRVLSAEPIDLVFLDIEMPGMNGIDLLGKLQPGDAQIIFVTGKEKYATQAFEFEVADYLVKPFSEDRFLKAISKVKKKHNSLKKTDDYDLFIKAKSRLVKINTGDIQFIEAVANYIFIHTSLTNKYKVLSTLKSIEGKFPEHKFMRIHNSYIVRIDKITAVEDNLVLLEDKSLPVSRVHWKPLLNRLNAI